MPTRDKSQLGTATIICPFFRCHAPTEIGCEGITDQSVIRLIFESRALRDKQEEVFCKNRYHYCELYKAIYEKYAGDD